MKGRISMMRLSHKSKTNTGKIWRIECLNKFEEWKDCVDYEGLYQVSNLGNVRSLDKYVWNRFQYVKRPGRTMKTHIDRYGYVRVVLRKDGKGVNEQVHRLVALAFINNPQQLPQVNHKDTNKQNNFAGTRENDYKDGNLEWCTNKENMKHAFNNIDFNYETIPVLQIDLRKQIVLAKYNSIQDAARSVGDNATNILRSCRFNNDSAKGYRWLIDDGLYQIGDYVDLPKLYHPSTKNKIYYPKKPDGSRITGYGNSYKRMRWDYPAPTITMRNEIVSSQENVHPGRPLPDGLWSDARVLTLRELLIVSSLPPDMDIPANLTETAFRQLIGEGIPPKLMKEIMRGIVLNHEE